MYLLSAVTRSLNRLIMSDRAAHYARTMVVGRNFAVQAEETQPPIATPNIRAPGSAKEAELEKQEQTAAKLKRLKKPNRRTLYVANIPMDVGENELYLMFSKIGQVKRFTRTYHPQTGVYRGYGFCDFADEDSATKAKEQLDGRELRGRKLVVKYRDEF